MYSHVPEELGYHGFRVMDLPSGRQIDSDHLDVELGKEIKKQQRKRKS